MRSNSRPLRAIPTILAGAAVAALVSGGAAAQQADFPQTSDGWFTEGQETLANRLAAQPNIRPARNVILFVGDGMGVATLTAARIHDGQLRGAMGEENFLSFEEFPNVALVKTYNTNQQVADSAGTAAAMNTGVKTLAGVINTNDTVARGDCAASLSGHVRTIAELAETAGMSTGVVSTARITHATPAAVYGHNPERNWEDDKDMSAEILAAGCTDYAQQLIDFPYGDGIDVAMGGGRRSFLPATTDDPEDSGKTGERQDGRDLTQEWVARHNDGAFVWNLAGFENLDLDNTGHLLGLFNGSHMEYEADRANDVGGEPSLTQMTLAAIEILSRNPEGFYLMVEGGRVDHAHHEGNANRALNDAVELSNAVRAAMAAVDPEETLIMVTADHSHVFTIAGYPTRGNPILGKVIGNDSAGNSTGEWSLADDDMPYTTVGYWNGPGAIEGARQDITSVDTTDVDYIQQAVVPLSSESHAGEDVALYAQGPMAHLVSGLVEQNYIFHVIDYATSLRHRAGVAQ